MSVMWVGNRIRKAGDDAFALAFEEIEQSMSRLEVEARSVGKT